MEKKVEVEINGKIVRVLPHMLKDMEKFGATKSKRNIKNFPKELLEPRTIIIPKVDVLPKQEIKEIKEPIEVKLTEVPEVKPDYLEQVKQIEQPQVPEQEKTKRKSPVRSKSKR